MINGKQYERYTTEDFAQDASFRTVLAAPTSESAQQWRAWMAAHPEKSSEFQPALELLRLLTPARQPVNPAQKHLELQQLLHAVRTPRVQPLTRVRHSRVVRLRLVAVFILVLLASVGLLARRWRPVHYATAYGQQQYLALPDGSTVVLNANSILRTSAWTPWSGREVWLTGEAYFHVARKAPVELLAIARATAPVKFIVHAGRLDVAVLGTSFNVTNRDGQANVVLTSGSVQVDLHDSTNIPTRLLMKPGELVESSLARPRLLRRKVDPTLYSAWTQGHLSFDHQTVAEVVRLLHNSYGLRVEVADSALLRQEITGSLPNANAQELLDALAKTLDLRVTRTNRHVLLEAAHQR